MWDTTVHEYTFLLSPG